jgi:hypothetical protein
MPTLFKILVVLFLHTLRGDGGSVFVTGISYPVQNIPPATLIFRTDPEFSSVASSICLQSGKGSETERSTIYDPTPTTTVTITYATLDFNDRKRIMEQLEAHRDRIKIQWVN